MWWELGAALRAICKRHYENFKLEALSFSSPLVISPNGISLRVCSAFSGTTGRYCFRQNLTLIAEFLHHKVLHLNLYILVIIPGLKCVMVTLLLL